MKFIIALLIMGSLQLNAASWAQNISIVRKNATLIEVFKELRKQTDYDFIYTQKQLSGAKKVSLNVRNVTINKVLDLCFAEQPFDYAIDNKTVVIKGKALSFPSRVINIKDSVDARGVVVDDQGNPIEGAHIKVKERNFNTVTDHDGNFSIRVKELSTTIIISYLGFETKEVMANSNMGKITLENSSKALKEVSIVSTGYQKIPKDRATGSFVHIDHNLINRSVSTNILDRLDGVTSGLIFPKNSGIGAPRSTIEIWGRSTLFSNAEPLIILDNFPYEGNLNNINPNDVESITILRDAAAASIWGARSGNGVVVITTKKGALNKKAGISIVSNLNISERPNLYYQPRLSSSEYIEVQKFLFDKGAYNTGINNGYSALSPAVELMLARRNGNISEENYNSELQKLAGIDSREQQLAYGYRTGINQQYQFNIDGGSENQKYFISVGHDQNRGTEVTFSGSRSTLNANNTYYLFNKKMEFNTGVVYTNSKDLALGSLGGFLYPYSQIADDLGNPLAVAKDLRLSFAENAGGGKLLDWLYRPLEELRGRYSQTTSGLNDYRINSSLNHKLIKGLTAGLYYSYGYGAGELQKVDKPDAYSSRHEINKLSQINPTTGSVTRPIPIGGTLESNFNYIESQNGRVQFDYSYSTGSSSINLIAGSEVRSVRNWGQEGIKYYGYNTENLSNQNSSLVTNTDFPHFYGNSTSRIILNPTTYERNNRNLSYYLNGAYTHSNKYIISFSARKDESNLFGVATNQKGVPLWSTGIKWHISKEEFYAKSWLPELSLRGTFGYTGNVNNSITALLTTETGSSNAYGILVDNITNPPNPSLRWERIKTLNLGLDFAAVNHRINGSFDLWNKKGIDLIGRSPIAGQTGIAQFTGNSANTSTTGIDLVLNSINTRGLFNWTTTVLYSHQRSKVTGYKASNGSNFNVVSANYNNPLEGYPYYGLFSFKYGGLDSQGNPQALANGMQGTNYNGIRNSTDRNDLVFIGSAVPTSFGSIRNTVSLKRFELSMNIIFKLGYYFRRNSLNNSTLYNTTPTFAMPDYSKRWQKPGDERTTDVPSLIYPSAAARTSIYTFSDVLVEKGDHVRLRDLRLGYSITNPFNISIKSLSIFCYANNLGRLWRANELKIDPDAVTGYPNPKTIAFGVNIQL